MVERWSPRPGSTRRKSSAASMANAISLALAFLAADHWRIVFGPSAHGPKWRDNQTVTACRLARAKK